MGHSDISLYLGVLYLGFLTVYQYSLPEDGIKCESCHQQPSGKDCREGSSFCYLNSISQIQELWDS